MMASLKLYRLSLALLVVLTAGACKIRPQHKESSPPLDASARAPVTPVTPPKPVIASGPPIAALASSPLRANTPAEAVAQATRAHYDPEELGLKRLAFTLRFVSVNPKRKIDVTGRAGWKYGQAVELKLESITRDGKPIVGREGLNETIWTSSRYKLRRLLDGIGEGFMRARLRQFKGRKGTIKIDGEQLVLRYDDAEEGQTTLRLGPGFRIVSISNASPLGANRTMTYEHKIIGGRNLVTKALLRNTIVKGQKLPQKGEVVMKATDGMLFELSYSKVGRFSLPTKLRRSMPARQEHLTLELSYSTVE